MTKPIQPAPLSDAELDRLEALLASDAFDAMPLDALQGLFFAIASGPGDVPRSLWLPVALGETRAGADDPTSAEAVDLIVRFHDQCAYELAAERFELHLYAHDDGSRDFRTWCSGYLDGVDLAQPAWEEAGDPDEVDEILFPFVVLAAELSDADKAQFKEAEWTELVRSCESALAEAIVEVREYWDVLRHPPATVRREAPKVGRNDPCPCGSGRKFKHCCSAPDAKP